jgi:phosphoenolpyruvate synthase/pyruvate phosphate dikinase
VTSTIPLQQLDGGWAGEVGAKAATLGELLRAGFPVPPGFAILPEVPDGPELAEAIDAACAALGDGLLAVRSSAVGEDSAGASFAGQHDTFLGVPRDAVREHVLRCRASLHSERAVAYRRQLGLDAAAARMGVLVQRLVDARAAGVVFTVDPGSGDRSRVVIEASWGLGIAVVGGDVLPDRWTVDRILGDVTGPGRSHKAVEWLRVGDGVRQLSVDSGRWSVPCISEHEVRELAALAGRVEELLGGPQDIEWALDEGGFQLLQSRPETVWSRRTKPKLDLRGPWSRIITKAMTGD